MTIPHSRKEAKAAGAKTYTGRPCLHGHSNLRYASTGGCVGCTAERTKKFLIKNPEKTKEYAHNASKYQAKYYENNRAKMLAKDAAYRKKHPEKRAKVKAAWVRKNRAHCCAVNARRRADLVRRTPIWLSDSDCDKINSFYLEARRLTGETGEQHHVDHILPLRGDKVSGLHVPGNLQVLTASENRAKKNLYTI